MRTSRRRDEGADRSLKGEPVIVVGAGISGLTAAFRLQQLGANVKVLEKSAAAGGRMTTVDHDGFRIDIGASLLFSKYGEMLKLIEDAGLRDLVIPTSDLLGFARNGQTHRIRTSKLASLASTGLLDMRSKAALVKSLAEAFRLRSRLKWSGIECPLIIDSENITSYANAQLGDDVFQYLLEPLHETLNLAPAERASAAEVLFYLSKLPGTHLFNSTTGIDFLPCGLAAQLPVTYGTEVVSVSENGDGVIVTWKRSGEEDHVETAAAAVIALPAPLVGDICPGLPTWQHRILDQIRYSRAVVVHFGLDAPPANEPTVWMSVPKSTHPDLVAMLLEHNKAPGRAPVGRGLVATYWREHWTRENWDLDDAEIVERALRGLESMFPYISAEAVTAHVKRWDICAAVHPPGSYQLLTSLRHDADPHSRIRLAGDYFAPSTTNTAVASGERAAREVLRALRSANGRCA